jgi:hypothetical protein
MVTATTRWVFEINAGGDMRFKTALGLAVVGLMVWSLAPPAWAHHAHGNYAEATVDMAGNVTEIHMIVPHPWIYLEVVSGDQKRLWALEGGGRREQGIKVGDAIKVRCHPLRDGTSGCLLGFVKTADGSVQDWDGKLPPPKDF